MFMLWCTLSSRDLSFSSVRCHTVMKTASAGVQYPYEYSVSDFDLCVTSWFQNNLTKETIIQRASF